MERADLNLPYRLSEERERLRRIEVSTESQGIFRALLTEEHVIVYRDESMIGMFSPSQCPDILKEAGADAVCDAVESAMEGVWTLTSELSIGLTAADMAAEESDASADALFLSGAFHQISDEYETAAKRFRAALAKDPGHALARFELGAVLLRDGVLDAAEEAFNAALCGDLDPQRRSRALRYVAMVHASKQEENAAGQAFERAVAAYPDDAESHLFFGMWLAAAQEFDAATDHLSAAVRLFDKTDALSLGSRRNAVEQAARLLMISKGNPRQALDMLEAQFQVDPFALQARAEFGMLLRQAYIACGDAKKAADVNRRIANARMPLGLDAEIDSRNLEVREPTPKRKRIPIVPIVIAVIVLVITIVRWVVK